MSLAYCTLLRVHIQIFAFVGETNHTRENICRPIFTSICTIKFFCIMTLPPGPRVLGIWGKWLFIFRELGSIGYYFQGFGEQAHSFGDLGSPAKK